MKASIGWTKPHVQLIVIAVMAFQPLLANTPRPPLDKLLPNPKAKLREQLGEVMRFYPHPHLVPAQTVRFLNTSGGKKGKNAVFFGFCLKNARLELGENDFPQVYFLFPQVEFGFPQVYFLFP